MISLDHFFLRFLLLGLAAGLFTGLYLAGRHWKPHWFDGQLRKLVWLSILILPLLAVPWPLPVLIPADTPDWVLAARLPDPKIIFPGTDLIEKNNLNFRGDPIIRPSTGAAGTDESASESASKFESALEKDHWLLDLQTRTTPWFWLLDHLAVVRLIYLVGFVINLLIRLIALFDHLRRRKQRGRSATPPIINLSDWLRDLAATRDMCGNYRRGQLVEMEPPTASWLDVWRCRRNRWLPIATEDLTCDDRNRRQDLILSALDLCRHPDLLMLSLFSFWRYLAWFTPVAWLSAGIFRQDQFLWHKESLQRQIGKMHSLQSDPDQHPELISNLALFPPVQRRGKDLAGPWIVRFIALLTILSLLGLALWQNPVRLMPDMSRAIIQQNQIIQPFGLTIAGHTEGDTGRAVSSYYGDMSGPGQLIGYLDESNSDQAVSGIIALDDQGGIGWKLPLSRLIDLELDGSDDSGRQAPLQFALNDYQVLPDGSYMMLGSIDMPAVDEMPLIIVQATADGQLVSWHLYDNNTGDMAQPYWINGNTYKLLANGDLLVVDVDVLENPTSASSVELVASMAVSYTLRRLTAEGEAVGSFLPDSDTMKTLNLGFWSRGAVSGYRSIANVIAAPDGGFFLVIETAITLMQIANTPATFYQHDGYYQMFNGNDQVARFSAEGRLLWLRELGEREMIVAVNQAVVGADGCLYLAATARYRRLQLMLPADNQIDILTRNLRTPDMSGPFYPYREAYQKAALYALAPDGRLLWQKELYGEHGAQARQIVLQDQVLSLLVYNDPYMGTAVQLIKRGLSCESIWQYDLAGHLTAYAPLPKADDYLEQTWFFVRPGFALLPDQPG